MTTTTSYEQLKDDEGDLPKTRFSSAHFIYSLISSQLIEYIAQQRIVSLYLHPFPFFRLPTLIVPSPHTARY